jgi:hypothetical protein
MVGTSLISINSNISGSLIVKYGKVVISISILLVLNCYNLAYSADHNIIMPFRAAKLSNWDGTAVDDINTIGKLLDSLKSKYFSKIIYDTIKTEDGRVKIIVICLVDYDKFSYSSELMKKYNEIKYVIVFIKQADMFFTYGDGNYKTNKDGVTVGEMDWTLLSIKEAVDKLSGKAEYIPDNELHKVHHSSSQPNQPKSS